MKRLILLCSLQFIVSFFAWTQTNSTGIPLITNYSSVENGFSEENYSVVQDKRGVMYFGNNENGVLEFDGHTWKRIPVPNNAVVASLAVDANGVVFVGTNGDFGYLKPDNSGQLNYESLVHLLDTADLQFSSVNKVYTFQNKVYFCSPQKIFTYDYSSVRVTDLPAKSFPYLSFLINNRFLIGTYDYGLVELNNDTVLTIRGGEFFREKDIMMIIPYEGNTVLVGTYADGVFGLDLNTGDINRNLLVASTNDFLKEKHISNGQYINDNQIGFGTLSNGVLVTDKKGNIVNSVDKVDGLQDASVYNLYLNPDNPHSPLWLTLSSGISKTEINSPFRLFGENAGLMGQVIDVIRFNGKLYVSTYQGVFILDKDRNGNPVFTQLPEPTKIQCWSMAKFTIPGTSQEMLVVGTVSGVYLLDKNNRVIRLEDMIDWEAINDTKAYFQTKYVYPSRLNKSRLYLGDNNGIHIVYFERGQWKKMKSFAPQADKHEIRSIVEDNDGNIWAGTFYDGVVCIKGLNSTPQVFSYTTEHGLPTNKDVNVFLAQDMVFFATSRGIYQYSKENDRFVPSCFFGQSYCDGSKGVYEVFYAGEGRYWLTCNRGDKTWIEEVIKNPDGTAQSISQPFGRLPNKWIDVIYPDLNGIVWFGMSNNLFSFDNKVKYDFNLGYNALIRSVLTGKDSVIFNGAYAQGIDSSHFSILLNQPVEMIPVIRFSNNNLTFLYASTCMENEKLVEYSYYLDGFKEYWSTWSTETKAVFTNLGPGDYVFKVKARNTYGVESTEATYAFTILPPWYRTVLAYFAYFILLIAFIWGVVKYNTRRLQLEKIRLEGIVKERTAEILKQKDEIETQRDQIIAQKKDITDSIRYASRIQRAVLPSDKSMKARLPEHFVLFKPRDIVSGDFYWMTQRDDKIVLVAADCTGHGVPGAFMSMLGMSFLNEIVNKSAVTQADVILNQLREHVITQLKQTDNGGNEETKDGMDIALMVIDKQKQELQFAGANNPLYVVRLLTPGEIASPIAADALPRGTMRNDRYELLQINADKMPIGTSAHNDVPFSISKLPLVSGYSLYVFTDGYEDQFGGPMGKKLMSKALKRMLLSIQEKSMEEQRQVLHKNLEDWRGDLEQVDDILLIGLKVI